MRVWHGKDEIGSVDPAVLAAGSDGPRTIALAGRSWRVTHIDWGRRRAWVEATDQAGAVRWSGTPQPLSAALCDAMRQVLLGDELAPVRLTRRATDRLATLRERLGDLVDHERTVLVRDEPSRARWWTWAGGRANALLATALGEMAPGLVSDTDRFDNRYLRLRDGTTRGELLAAVAAARQRWGRDLAGVLPQVSEEALKQLKFAELLPPDLARDTLAARLVDAPTAAETLDRGIITRVVPG